MRLLLHVKHSEKQMGQVLSALLPIVTSMRKSLQWDAENWERRLVVPADLHATPTLPAGRPRRPRVTAASTQEAKALRMMGCDLAAG